MIVTKLLCSTSKFSKK